MYRVPNACNFIAKIRTDLRSVFFSNRLLFLSLLNKLVLINVCCMDIVAGNIDIVNGNLKLILGLIWSLIVRYQIGPSKFPPKKLMLAWLKVSVLEYYSKIQLHTRLIVLEQHIIKDNMTSRSQHTFVCPIHTFMYFTYVQNTFITCHSTVQCM